MRLGGAAAGVLGVAQLAALHVLHYDVEEVGVVIDFVDFDDVGVLELSGGAGTLNMISHSFL